jgi:hypothetical protein
MKKIFDIRHIVIFIMMGIIIYSQFFIPPQIQIKETMVYDTIPKEVLLEVEVPYEIEVEVEKIVEVLVQPVVDTSYILQKYYIKNYESDTIILKNKQGSIYLFDTISQNKVISRKFISNIRPKIVREPSPEPPKIKNRVYVGLNGSLSRQDWVNSIGTSVLLKTKDEKIFQIGVGVANRTFDGTTGNFVPYVTGGVYWELKLNKD